MIIYLNHRDQLFCDDFETPNNNNDYLTIIAIIGLTINPSDASLKSMLVFLKIICNVYVHDITVLFKPYF